MDKGRILEVLKALSEILAERGIKGDLFLVGGAALAVAYNARRATRDVDAVFSPKAEIYKAAEEVAKRLNLPPNWLNDAVKGFLEKSDPAPLLVFDEPGLRVMAASARFLLAMKLLAARREDEEDIRFLCNHLKIGTAREALDVLLDVYPETQIRPKTRFIVEELLGPVE